MKLASSGFSQVSVAPCFLHGSSEKQRPPQRTCCTHTYAQISASSFVDDSKPGRYDEVGRDPIALPQSCTTAALFKQADHDAGNWRRSAERVPAPGYYSSNTTRIYEIWNG
jgi:hypothetical protein